MARKRYNTHFNVGEIVVVAGDNYLSTGNSKIAKVIKITSGAAFLENVTIEYEDGSTDAFENSIRDIVIAEKSGEKSYFKSYHVYTLDEAINYARYMIKTREKLEKKYDEKIRGNHYKAFLIEGTEKNFKEGSISESDEVTPVSKLKRKFGEAKIGDNVIVKYIVKSPVATLPYSSIYEIGIVKSIKFTGNKKLSMWVCFHGNVIVGSDRLTDKNSKIRVLASESEDECGTFYDGYFLTPRDAIAQINTDTEELMVSKNSFINQRILFEEKLKDFLSLKS